MIIESLSLKNYRNYENLNLNFSDGTNIFYGNNAQGKTNILEALYLCSTSKSHRGSKDKDIRQALVDRFAPNTPNGGKGSKDDQGWFYGFRADIWSAYAVAITYYDLYLKGGN